MYVSEFTPSAGLWEFMTLAFAEFAEVPEPMASVLDPHSRFRPFDGFQCRGMHLDQVGIDQQATYRGPKLQQQAFEFGLADISQPNPNHLRR